MSLKTAETKATCIEPTIPPAVTGWLLFLCLVLTLLYPATTLYHLTSLVPLLIHAHSLGFIFLLSYSVVLTFLAVFSFLAGLKLWLVKLGAVSFARRWLWSYLIANIAHFVWFIVVAKPSLVSVTQIGFDLVVPIAFFALWYFYLEHSRRVRATYPSR